MKISRELSGVGVGSEESEEGIEVGSDSGLDSVLGIRGVWEDPICIPGFIVVVMMVAVAQACL